jgi:peptidoglycan lytic transglycosylase G
LSIRKLLLRSVALVLVICVALAGWAAHFVYAPLGFGSEAREFDIEDRSTLRGVAQNLRSAGVLPDAWRFEILARMQGKAGAVKAGSYQIDPQWSALQLLQALTGSTARLDRIMLAEGWTFRQVRRALDEHSALRHETSGKSDLEVAALLELGAHPEGLLFPDTYHFAKGATDLSVLQRAALRMRRLLDEQWEQRADGLPMKTPYEALVLASIVEKETGRVADRPMIAGVFVNRLRKGMKLQADPTVIYGLGEAFDGNLRRRDLEADGPYNTYVRTGLPPTPIALPSLASLVAVLRPQATNALYFVSRGDGSSEFSESLPEHNRAVTKYQRQQATTQ